MLTLETNFGVIPGNGPNDYVCGTLIDEKLVFKTLEDMKDMCVRPLVVKPKGKGKYSIHQG